MDYQLVVYLTLDIPSRIYERIPEKIFSHSNDYIKWHKN